MSTRPGVGGTPRIASSWATISVRSNRTSASRSTRGSRSISASQARSGWPGRRSSVRIVATIASRSLRRLRARNASRSRVDGSAQWMSSMTRRTGSRLAEPPEQTEEPLEDPALEPVPCLERRRLGLGPIGQLGDEPGELGRRRPERLLELRRARSARPAIGGPRRSARTADRSRRAGRTRRPGRAERSARPTRPAPGRSARIRATSSAMSRLLPIPASPSTRITDGCPPTAASNAASSCASSARRPTKTGLETRPDTGRW